MDYSLTWLLYYLLFPLTTFRSYSTLKLLFSFFLSEGGCLFRGYILMFQVKLEVCSAHLEGSLHKRKEERVDSIVRLMFSFLLVFPLWNSFDYQEIFVPRNTYIICFIHGMKLKTSKTFPCLVKFLGFKARNDILYMLKLSILKMLYISSLSYISI